MGIPPHGWFMRESSIKMDDLGVPPFQETSISSSPSVEAKTTSSAQGAPKTTKTSGAMVSFGHLGPPVRFTEAIKNSLCKPDGCFRSHPGSPIAG